MTEKIRMLFAAAAASCLFLLLFLKLKWNLIFCIVLSVGIYFGLYLLLKPRRKMAGIDLETLPEGEEIEALMGEARADLEQIRKAAAAIENASCRSQAESLYGTGKGILAYLEENPKKIRQARRFFIYYLDTAASILSRYVEFQKTGLQSEEVSRILSKSEDALPVLNDAFETQFTRLMQGELMDAEVDIEMLNKRFAYGGKAMKTKLTGLAILILVIIAAVVYVFFSRKNQTAEISGYLGGEKIGLLEDEEVQDILKGRYHLVIDYSKAGSLDMITADFTDRDYLFPSNQTALELYEEIHGDPVQSQIIFNTPIVLYTRSAVAKALAEQGIVREEQGIYYVDMTSLAEEIEAGSSWSDLGLPSSTAMYPWAPPIPLNPTPAICLPPCWPTRSARLWRMSKTSGTSFPGSRTFSGTWATWKVPPQTCLISF